MKENKFIFILLFLWSFFVVASPSFAGITFNQNQAELVIAPTCNHVPISIPYNLTDESYDESLITVLSDSSWAIPSVNSALNRIEIAFSTKTLIASYTATISVNDGEKVVDLFIDVVVPPLDILRLVDDPTRPVTYGIQRNGINNGSIIAFDPLQESITSCITIGKGPTDFAINDDSSELLVINSVGKNIDVIDLKTFSHKETINLPSYSAWGTPSDTTANIDLGPADIIYYSDGAWGPVLHVLKRSTNTILQSIIFNGSAPSNNTGFMDFAVTSDKTKLIAMPQYGWSAGSHSPTIGQFTINGNGTVTPFKVTTLSSFSREPFEAPVLLSNDDKIAAMKTISTDPSNTDNLKRVFPSAIWSMLPNGKVVATGDRLYEYDTGIELYRIPGGSTTGPGYLYTKAQVFTSDYSRFIYFNSSNRTLNVVNLISEIGVERMGVSMNPKDKSVIVSPEKLAWEPIVGVKTYDVYLGTDHGSISAADRNSPYYLGSVTGSSFALQQNLISGTEYFWRIDPVMEYGNEKGIVYSFRISDIGIDKSEINAQTVAGHSDYQVDIQLVSEQPGLSWSASAADSWVTFTGSTGTTPSTLSVHLDSTSLLPGLHNTTITIDTGLYKLQIPVKFHVQPLMVTHIRSDRDSAKAYAISEDTSSVVSQAYLLEVDSAAEKILRVIPVGTSVTDLSIHYADNLIYVTNWKSGALLAIDRSTFKQVKSHAFSPAGATGYSQGDVYRVAAGVSKRLVVEEQDQWVDISIYNTSTGTILKSAGVREGGGAFDPTGRYYYHGENNSSGASIIKFDTSGDIFTQIAEVRPPDIFSYYGSRTVIVSEDGSQIFWAGMALDKDLVTKWRVGEIVYSTSDDGRYAFCQSAIYDVNLKRQVFAMPTSTTVSGFNSTSKKLMAQVGGALGFYDLSTPISMPAPTLNFNNKTNNSTELSWTDKSLEMGFSIQQRVIGSDTWTNIKNTAANVTSFTVTGLQPNLIYEFRVRATSPDYSSPWSNICANRSAPNVTVWPDASPIVYGQKLANSTLTGGSASVPGIFAFTMPTITPNAGIGNQSVIFTPTDGVNYVSVVNTAISVTVNKANQTISTPTFNPTKLEIGDTATVSATGGISGNAVTFSSKTTGVCTVIGTTVIGVGYGTCTIAADQLGNADYAPATQVTANIEVIYETLKVAQPVFTPPAGTYKTAATVAISSPTPGAQFRYTLDGTTPTNTTGTLYSAPVYIGADKILKAVGFRAGSTNSNVISADYSIVTQTAAMPVVGPTGGLCATEPTVSITSATPGAIIRFTTDGTIPTQGSGLVYAGPFTLYKTATVKAVAYAPGVYGLSGVGYSTYTLKVRQPIFTPPQGTYSTAQNVAIVSKTNGSTIRYTLDGSTPTSTTGTLYTGPVTVSATQTLKAAGFKTGYTDSNVITAAYTIVGASASRPTFSPAGGTYTNTINVTLASATAGATIRYTTDFTTPTQNNGTIYTTSVKILSGTTIKAIAYKPGANGQSAVATAAYTLKVGQPTFTPAAGTYATTQTVALATTTTGAEIRYTLDGTAPTATTGTVYTAPLVISKTTTLNARAFKPSFTDSNLVTANYVISNYHDAYTGMDFVWVPAGSFIMGDAFGEGNVNETPAHSVTLTKGFYMSAYETTQEQWELVKGATPSYFQSATSLDQPVEMVNYSDVLLYIAQLNATTGLTFRLPTEAEWEYAAGYDTSSLLKYSGTSDLAALPNYAWYSVNGANTTHSVGAKLPNALGIYDLSGNVAEWVSDWYGTYATGAFTDPTGPVTGTTRIIKGGSWQHTDPSLRAAYRASKTASTLYQNIGFRLIVEP